MATLSRTRQPEYGVDDVVDGSIPSPFPSHFLGPTRDEAPVLPQSADAVVTTPGTTEAISQLATVQQSCMMVLNAILSPYSDRWRPILPPRRHSAPARVANSIPPELAQIDTKTVLRTIVSNIPDFDASSLAHDATESEYLAGIGTGIDHLACNGALPATDSSLASSLVSLLLAINRVFQITPAETRPVTPEWAHSDDVYGSLSRTVIALQSRRAEGQSVTPSGSSLPSIVVEQALSWTSVDTALEETLRLCQQHPRDSTSLYSAQDTDLPPEYDIAPPSYDPSSSALQPEKSEKAPVRHAHSTPDLHSLSLLSSNHEKMRMELDTVTMAIDRLYTVAPQLHAQRVELNTAKQTELELARILGGVERLSDRIDNQRAVRMPQALKPLPSRKGKEKANAGEPSVDELDSLLDLIGRSQSRLEDQRVESPRLVPSSISFTPPTLDYRQRDVLADQIVKHQTTGRLAAQDATFTSKSRNSLSPSVSRDESNRPGPSSPPRPVTPKLKNKRSFIMRERSTSAPPRWFGKPASGNASSSQETPDTNVAVVSGALYVAEYQENLGTIQVYISLKEPSSDIGSWSVEVLSDPSSSTRLSDRLSVRSQFDSLTFVLPTPVSPGPKSPIFVQEHLEIKLSVPSPHPISPETPTLLDAAHLASLSPTSFACSSCSSPIVQCSRAPGGSLEYQDLPTEYWAEFIESWMCHPDQKLSSSVVKSGSGGYSPSSGTALVGGSYVLFDESVIVSANVKIKPLSKNGDGWHPVKCFCGASIGAFRAPVEGDNVTYRFAKYAMRPVNPTQPSIKIPLSAFIAADMFELVQAHATYRYVIRDEEDEKVRVLLWLFNPSIRLSHTHPKPYVLPRSNVSQVAKVFYKLIGPSETISPNGLQVTNPDFAQAEHLFYPMPICHSLAVALLDSNRMYPASRRSMNGLDIGWLQKA